MMEQYVEPCIYCHKDIVFSEGSSVVVCSACGRKMAVSSFQSRQLQMRKALEEGEAAKENLKAAEQAKQEANERLFSVISALSDIQSSQENAEEKINAILNTLQGEEQLKKVIIHLLQGIRSEQGNSRDVLTRLMATVASGQDAVERKLVTLSDLARIILDGQQDVIEQTKSTSRIVDLLQKANLSILQQRTLVEDYIQWSKSLNRDEIERLQSIQRDLDEILTRLHEMDRKVDEIRQRVAGLQKSIDSFHDQWQADKLEELNKLYQMASGYQSERNYSKAAEYYQQILVKGGESPEIYWRLILCHYCVDYQEDDDGTLVPIILNPDLTDSVQLMVRKNYREHLSQDEKWLYSAELLKIDSILEKYRQVHLKTQYDVFISVKQNDRGAYTEDSNKASDLFDYLVSKGLRVFNSRRTKIPAGQEYEPYIISALMSARVMIVAGSRPDYLRSRWIQNEWLRFQWLRQNEIHSQGETDRVLFCYLFGNMKPEQIPKTLNPNCQAIIEGDHSRSELDKVINSVFPNLKKKDNSSSISLQQTINQMTTWLLAKNYQAVTDRYHQLTNAGTYLDNTYIHLFALCARLNLQSIDMLEKQGPDILDAPEFLAAEKLGQDKAGQKLLKKIRMKVTPPPKPVPPTSPKPIPSIPPKLVPLQATLNQMFSWLSEENYQAVLDKYHELKNNKTISNNTYFHLFALCARLKLQRIDLLEKQGPAVLDAPEFLAAEQLGRDMPGRERLQRIRMKVMPPSPSPTPEPRTANIPPDPDLISKPFPLQETLDQMFSWLSKANYQAVLDKYHEQQNNKACMNNTYFHLFALCARLNLQSINKLEKQKPDILNAPEFFAAQHLGRDKAGQKYLRRIRNNVINNKHLQPPNRQGSIIQKAIDSIRNTWLKHIKPMPTWKKALLTIVIIYFIVCIILGATGVLGNGK